MFLKHFAFDSKYLYCVSETLCFFFLINARVVVLQQVAFYSKCLYYVSATVAYYNKCVYCVSATSCYPTFYNKCVYYVFATPCFL